MEWIAKELGIKLNEIPAPGAEEHAAAVPAMWADNKNLTTAAAGLPPAPFGILQGFIVPKAVPDEHRKWLSQLIKAATEVEVHKAREKSIPGLTIKILKNAKANAAKKQNFEYVRPVVRDLGMHFEQRELSGRPALDGARPVIHRLSFGGGKPASFAC